MFVYRFARAHNLTETTQLSTQPKEESILPDDDDVIISDCLPTPAISNDTVPKNKHLLPINKVTSQGPPIPKIKISKGKIVITPSLVIPPGNTIVQKPSAVSDTENDTICLDSDEEETITPTVQPTSKDRKLVAVKSTAKRQQPVPVQLTAANPVNPGLPQIIPESIPTLQSGVITLGTSNMVVIPASQANKLTKLPQGVIPTNAKNISRIFVGSQNSAVSMQIPNNVNLQIPQADSLLNATNILMNQMPQNLNLVNQTPQNVNLLNQNLNVTPQTPFTLQPQNMNVVGSMPTNVFTTPQIVNSTSGTTMNLGSITTASICTQNASTSESILPTLPSKTLSKPGPASSKVRNKTVCKPGDILRITKTGQVEILNRDDNDVIVGQPKATTSTKQSKGPQTTVSLLDDEEPVRLSSKTNKIETKTKKKRSRKISSSSSSSSNSSRPSSPNDPLSILKDVVHIQASEDPIPAESTPTKSNLDSEKSSITNSASSTPSKTTRSQNDSVPKAKKDKILDQINKTNSVLMKLNDVFGPAEKKAKKQNIGKIDSIDLTDLTPSTSTVLDKLSKDIKIGKTLNNTPTKIVGTSKNIILTGSGKATVASVENQ